MSIQPSEDEILREVEALRDIKRRSTAQGGPGTLTIDPDLPELSPSPSNTHPSSTWSGPNGNTSDSLSNANNINDPSHLFWVPARLHPEIAPQEFKEFLKEHSRDGSTEPQSDGSQLLSPGSIKVSRRKSMLSRQYKPSDKDGAEEDQVIIRRNTLSSRAAPQLTINDLQKLDEIAQAVSQGEDISNLSTMLRRSLSLSSSETADLKSADLDVTDSPIIIPPPNQILRRAARTKIRKTSLQGDGGGHRFPSTRRGTRSNTISTTDGSEHDHDDSIIRISHEPETENDIRPSSYTDETSIFDSYSDKRDSLTSSESHERSEDDQRTATSPPPVQIPSIPSTPHLQLDLQPFEITLTSAPDILHEPTPQEQLIIPTATDTLLSRSPSPTPSDSGSTELALSSHSPATSPQKEVHQPTNEQPQTSKPTRPTLTPTPSLSHSKKEKDKEKKGLFGKWGSDKKKNKVEAVRAEVKESREKEKEKDSGFFGSLFGGKKKPEESSTVPSQGNANPATTVAHLGSNKVNRPNVRTPSPQPPGSYARYPIHVERAIYRLSHIKLANARRPLLEQVLISNLMFWYLSIINKPATPGPPTGPNQTFEQITQQQMQASPNEKEVPPQERGDMERERFEHERQEREARERSEAGRRESGRKGSLTKGGKSPNEGVRRTEAAVKGPQYESQYRAVEQEYTSSNFNGGGYSNQGSPVPRTGSAPPAPMSSSPVYQQYANHRLTPQQVAQNKAATVSNPNFYDNTHLYHPQPVHQPNNPSYLLPPGAMSPQINSWQSPPSGSGNPTASSGQGPYVYNPSPSPPPSNSSANTNQQRSSHSPPPRQPRSPPPQNYQSNIRARSTTPPGGRIGRSVSVEAIPATGNPNVGKLRKKASSFQASNTDSALNRQSVDDGTGDDVPLAVWQQQHRTSHQSGTSA